MTVFFLLLCRIFQFQTDTLTFFNALSSCKSKHGRLAEPRNQQQFDVITQFLEGRRGRFWIGGSDLLAEGMWLWNSDNSTVDLNRFFIPNEPNTGNNERCLEYLNFNVNDRGCNANQQYLCEFGLIGNVPVCPD